MRYLPLDLRWRGDRRGNRSKKITDKAEPTVRRGRKAPGPPKPARRWMAELPKDEGNFGLLGFFSAAENGRRRAVSYSRFYSKEELECISRSRPGESNPYARIFPRFVATTVCSGEVCKALYSEEMALVRRVPPQRAWEFTAGRLCAHRALADLGVKGRPLLVGANGAPEWPKGIVGSISHTTGFCVAAACRIRDAIGLGVDVESLDGATRETVEVLCTKAERRWVGSIPIEKGAVLLFSAKESFFKGYHPLTGFFLEFCDVEVTFDPSANRFTARLVNDNAPSIFGVRAFHGRYWIGDRFVYTGLCLLGQSEIQRKHLE
jgi:4'-phosphopantetheinyl transferase EntD